MRIFGASLDKLAGPLIKVDIPLSKKFLTPLATTASASAIDGAIQRKMLGKGITLVISNEEMNDIIKIIKSQENSGALIDGVSETVKHEIKRQEGGSLGMFLVILGASVLENILAGKGVLRA